MKEVCLTLLNTSDHASTWAPLTVGYKSCKVGVWVLMSNVNFADVAQQERMWL